MRCTLIGPLAVKLTKRPVSPIISSKRGERMSTREQIDLLASRLPEHKLNCVLAYMQGLLVSEDDTSIEMSDDEKIDFVAGRILREHKAAFEELAK